MVAEELFLERLEKFGMKDYWECYGRMAEETPDGIVLFVHEDDYDNYSEIHYPTFNKLREDETFVKNALDFAVSEWEYNEEDFKKLASWLYGYNDDCPLEAEDVYHIASHLQTYYRDFVDSDVTPIGMLKDNFEKYSKKKSLEEISNLYEFGMECFSNAVKKVERAFPELKEQNTEDEFWWDDYRSEMVNDYIAENAEGRLRIEGMRKFAIVDEDGMPKRDRDYDIMVFTSIKDASEQFEEGVDTAIMSVTQLCNISHYPIKKIIALDI